MEQSRIGTREPRWIQTGDSNIVMMIQFEVSAASATDLQGRQLGKHRLNKS